ncbi:AAA family ATPase [Candidatus Allofournierella merdipullorum]|uniref:SF1B family DNA helicase RecD2 n=1 Tax=Candidatus Allofournierella merdipullorum TaxID=2838595 RepID=UPI00374F01B8
MVQLGEKVSFIATYKSDLFQKDDWRICAFEAKYDPSHFPGTLDEKSVGKEKKIIVKGKFTTSYIGEILELTGEWTFNKKGQEYQFAAQLAIPNVPTDIEEAKRFVRYSVKGIGPKLAQMIIDWCGGDLSKVSEQPMVVAASIKGLTERKAKLLASKIDEASATSALTRLLKRVVEPTMIRRLVNEYGRDVYEQVTKNPYEAASIIGFEHADRIALALDFQPQKPARIEAAALYALNQLKAKNNSIIVSKPLHRQAMCKLLNMNVPRGSVKEEMMDEAISRLKQGKKIAGANGYFYLREDWEMERSLAERIYTLGQSQPTEEEAARFCAAFDLWRERHPDIKLHANQTAAVYAAANLFSVVTGGPGTGKTTVLKAIMETYAILFPDSPITLMAPTGLAAKRMTESCERKALTIHKALGLTPANTSSGFEAAKDKRISGGLIIVDEFSMVGIHLANFLLSAIDVGTDTRIVFVGDIEQLPPVTPGCVLHDLIYCGKVHVTRLTKNFRQASGSCIADVAIKINTGNVRQIRFENDCQFMDANGDEEIRQSVLKMYMRSIKKFGFEQTFCITPTHNSTTDPLSSNSLNKALQDMVNPLSPNMDEVVVGSWRFRVGDRVINKKNTEDVINGDIGYIIEMIPEDVGVSLKIDFSGNQITFPPERLKNLELAYAITVHSSQGCEFASVIMPVSEKHHFMLTRNLVYTAITRAKKNMLLIGSRAEVGASAVNTHTGAASDMLMTRIRSIGPRE